jgi:hypothetical protein
MLDKLGHRPHRAGALVALRDVFLDHREREMAADRRDVRGLDAGIGEPATECFPEAVQCETRRQPGAARTSSSWGVGA